MSIAWTIFITLMVMLAQGAVYSKWGLNRIKYTRTFSQETAFEGEEVEMIDRISNHKLLPLPWLRLESKMNPNLVFHKSTIHPNLNQEDDQFHRTLFTLLPFQKITRRHKLTCVKRGYYPLQTVSIATGDVIGFGETFQSVEAKASMTVYPRIVPIKEIPLPSHSWLGDITVRRWIVEDPFLYAGVREYAYGDPMNAVNWKATARTGQLQINKRDFTADHHLMIYVNFDLSEDFRLPIYNEAVIERGLSYAASIANHTISNGIQTGFGCNAYFVEPFTNSTDPVKESVRIEPSSSNGQIAYLLDTIAKLKMDRSRTFFSFLQEDIDQERTNADILIITAIVTDKMQVKIRQLETMGNAVEVVQLQDDMGEVGEEIAQ
ncbi:DUF58 domain-containing protein [Aquibacillus kalidii]|uniref:DUF58 domain-containing protein n=1 Tax=Aquibacillus kalidii TaxID=2762597 RepID=UPI001647592B|nr:DUF58 domain-containing protein [Aquibacillus kalidii]